jgi:non-ribosomal peptide synthetase component F
LEKILVEMMSCTHGTIGELDCLSYRDRQQIQNWNSIQKPKYHFDCVHRVFEYYSRLEPSANAICSWDGNMTYSELNKHASSVALQLVELGVCPGVYVPFCFEKSMWAVVATLAILKAGAAFVPLDSDHPISRVKDILQSVGAKVVVASLMHAHLFTHVVDHVVILSSPNVGTLLNTPDCTFSSPAVTPQDAVFLLFTSGSTGRPKGIIQEHCSVVSNAFAHGKVMHYRKDSRVLQFAAHTFDVAQSKS